MLKKILFVLGCAMTYYGTAKANPFAVRDSIGVTSQNGRTYITHKVEPKETLFALSRKYGVTVAQIVEANKLVNQSISIGQIVLVPMRAGAATATASAPKAVPTTARPTATSPATTATATAAPSAPATAAGKTYVVDSNGNKVHTVQARQTLYSISRMYGVSVENIKKWNNLTDNSVAIGVNLVVGTGEKATAQTAAKTPIYVPEHDEEVSLPKQASTATTTTTKPATTTASTPVASAPVTASRPATTSTAAKPVTTPSAPATTPAASATATKPASETPSKTSEYTSRVNESGMAEQIDQRSDASKFLALHKTAPVGTIMAVKNPENDQTVYVRVIGKLPDTGENENIVVKISKKACQQIGVVDKRFRVELSYMP